MPDPIADLFINSSVKRMQLSEDEINRCLAKLSDAQIQHRGADYENSIANLLLHLEGNLRQWFLHGIGGEPDIRQREAEFALASQRPWSEIRAAFAETLARCKSLIGALPAARLLETIDPQPTGHAGGMTILEAIYRILGHLQLHQGQIILLTKQLTAADLDFTIPRSR